MAGGCGYASHGGVTLSRGWLCQRCKPLDIPGTHLHLATQLLMAGKWEQGSCILPPTSTCYCSPGLKHLRNGFSRAYKWWGSYRRGLTTEILSEIITFKNVITNQMHFNTFGRGLYWSFNSLAYKWWPICRGAYKRQLMVLHWSSAKKFFHKLPQSIACIFPNEMISTAEDPEWNHCNGAVFWWKPLYHAWESYQCIWFSRGGIQTSC